MKTPGRKAEPINLVNSGSRGYNGLRSICKRHDIAHMDLISQMKPMRADNFSRILSGVQPPPKNFEEVTVMALLRLGIDATKDDLK